MRMHAPCGHPLLRVQTNMHHVTACLRVCIFRTGRRIRHMQTAMQVRDDGAHLICRVAGHRACGARYTAAAARGQRILRWRRHDALQARARIPICIPVCAPPPCDLRILPMQRGGRRHRPEHHIHAEPGATGSDHCNDGAKCLARGRGAYCDGLASELWADCGHGGDVGREQAVRGRAMRVCISR